MNPELVESLEKAGLRFVGKDTEGDRMEIVELESSKHPFFLACQYHPEYKSRPNRASPPFKGLLEASKLRAAQKKKTSPVATAFRTP